MKIHFRTRMLLTITGACVLCMATAIVLSNRKLDGNGKDALVEKSRGILSRLEVGAGYVAEMDTLDAVIAETLQKFPDGQVPDDQKLKVLKSVPIFAAFKIGETESEKENYHFRIASDNARNKTNTATPEEKTVLDRFRADPGLKEIVEVTSDEKFVRVTRPVRISQARGCLNCHGEPSHSPWKNGKDILGYGMESMKDGDLKGSFTIISSLDPVKASVQASTREISIFGTLVTAVALLFGFFMIRGPIGRITQIARNLNDVADGVASMSSEIASTSDRLSNGATQQATALQETSASMEQVRSMVAKNSENATLSSKSAGESQKAAERGQTVVGEMIQSIEEIDRSNHSIMTQIEESNRQIEEIVKVIADIGNKTKVINDIVFQTKLLSFNASVEAARAGEHGKGFAVVAEEVGNLAQMSGNASQEISSMLEGSIAKVESIVRDTKSKVGSLVETGKSKVQAGTEVAKRCGSVLKEIVSGAQSMTQMVNEIAMGSQEQSKGVEEIGKAVLQLDQVTQENAASSQESAMAAEQLSSQAALLRTSVSSLIQTLDGESGSAEKPEIRPSEGSGPEKVISLSKRAPRKVPEPTNHRPLKKAAGAENSVPSADDVRFEDV